MTFRLGKASFVIRKWRKNDETLGKLIQECEGSDNTRYKTDENFESYEKVLGVEWNECQEIFIFRVNKMFEDVIEIVPSKRRILSLISSIYDPVGFLQPLTVKLKLLFQSICISGIGWDDPIVELFYKKWLNIVKNFKSYKNVYLERCYFVYDMNDPIEFAYWHGFSDASTLAYGTCVDIKSVSKAGNIKISFVASKSRLVPLKKKLSTPRLELLGNFILAKLINVVYNALLQEVIIRSHYCWSDSMTSLAWIVARHKEFKLIVENRVIVIRNLIPIDGWHYVSTKENVADIITRFHSIDLVNNSMWWKGPKFLYCHFEESSHNRKNVDFVNLEDSLLTQYNDEVKNVRSVNYVYHAKKIYRKN